MKRIERDVWKRSTDQPVARPPQGVPLVLLPQVEHLPPELQEELPQLEVLELVLASALALVLALVQVLGRLPVLELVQPVV